MCRPSVYFRPFGRKDKGGCRSPYAFRRTRGKSIVFSLFILGFYAGRKRAKRGAAILYGALGITKAVSGYSPPRN